VADCGVRSGAYTKIYARPAPFRYYFWRMLWNSNAGVTTPFGDPRMAAGGELPEIVC